MCNQLRLPACFSRRFFPPDSRARSASHPVLPLDMGGVELRDLRWGSGSRGFYVFQLCTRGGWSGSSPCQRTQGRSPNRLEAFSTAEVKGRTHRISNFNTDRAWKRCNAGLTQRRRPGGGQSGADNAAVILESEQIAKTAESSGWKMILVWSLPCSQFEKKKMQKFFFCSLATMKSDGQNSVANIIWDESLGLIVHTAREVFSIFSPVFAACSMPCSTFHWGGAAGLAGQSPVWHHKWMINKSNLIQPRAILRKPAKGGENLKELTEWECWSQILLLEE